MGEFDQDGSGTGTSSHFSALIARELNSTPTRIRGGAVIASRVLHDGDDRATAKPRPRFVKVL